MGRERLPKPLSELDGTPLVRGVEAAGVEWTRRAQLAVQALEPEPEEEQPKPPGGAHVLAKLMAAVADYPDAIITSEEVDKALGNSAPEWRAIKLKEVGLNPRRYSKNGRQVRGYRMPDIRRAADQYPVG